MSLAGRPAISALNLIVRVTLIQADQKEIAEQFSELFKCLWQMTGKYQIKLQPNMTSFVLTTSRRITIASMSRRITIAL